MSALRPQLPKRSKKQQRELEVLLGLVDLYVQTGKPIGSNTLRDHGFPKVSSATIRNYFAHLESEGYLHQTHASGGRVPTAKAFQVFADHHQEHSEALAEDEEALHDLQKSETRAIASYLQEGAELLSDLTGMAVFLSAPRFDHDFIRELKLVYLDAQRILAVILTDFGVVDTEILRVEEPVSERSVTELKRYFDWRFAGAEGQSPLSEEESALAHYLYNELMVRYVVGYSNFTNEDIHRTGFAQLLQYPEFSDVVTLAGGLSLFENHHSMRLLLRECGTHNRLRTWIGNELDAYVPQTTECAVIAIPYRVQGVSAGAVGLLGPTRIDYKRLFGILRTFTDYVSETLTRSVCTHKISYRQADNAALYLQNEEQQLVGENGPIMLEDKTKRRSRRKIRSKNA